MRKKIHVYTGVVFVFFLFFFGCNVEELPETFYKEEDLLISSYLEEHPDEFSSLLEVLEITNLKPILNAYGHYTFFAPDDDAFDLFCRENGCSCVEDFDIEYLKTLVKYHLLDIDIETSFLPNGVLSDTTFTGDNLVFTFNEGGLNSIMINGEATIIKRDIRLGNGNINKIDKVLKPVTKSIYHVLLEKEEYRIFTKTLEITGLNDTLSIIKIPLHKDKYIRGRFTLFVESDKVFHMEGIYSVNDLIDKYSDSDNPADKNNGLYKFMAYHCIPGLYYLNTLNPYNYSTLCKNTLINIDISDGIYLNRHILGGSEYQTDWCINVIRDESNKPVKNGVYHVIDKILEPWDPEPVYCKFEFTDYQGIAIDNIYTSDDLRHVKGISCEDTYLWYRNSVIDEDSSYLETTSNSVGWSVEFVLPPIVKGKYDVYLHWVSDKDRTPAVQVFWDDQRFRDNISLNRKVRSWETGSREWKHDIRIFDYLGTLILSETQSHTIKFISLQDGIGVFDYISFHPI